MKAAAVLSLAALLGVLATPPVMAGNVTAFPDLAQAQRCGPRPMKPASCLNGTWVCRCHASGQICDWELVGCGTTGGLTPGSSIKRPSTSTPADPTRPGTR